MKNPPTPDIWNHIVFYFFFLVRLSDVLGLFPNPLAFSSFLCENSHCSFKHSISKNCEAVVMFVQISLDGRKKTSQFCGSLVEAIFFSTPKMNFERWSFRTCGESSWWDVESSKPGFDVWMKFLNNSTSYAVFLFAFVFSCSSTNLICSSAVLLTNRFSLSSFYNKLKI